MAKIYPFRALRYDAARVNPADVLTQPYDKITPALQERYYNRSPYNLVRIILGRREPDTPSDNVYTRAAGYLREWRSSGILVPDPTASIYAYSQSFEAPGSPASKMERRGFIALGKIEDYSAGIVHRHEQTLSGPKTDRFNLLCATRAHFGQIFMLYEDPEEQVDNLLFRDQHGVPDLDVCDDYEVRHRVWRVSDPQVIGRVQESMLNKKLIIADGHHRYETALNYRNKRRGEAGGEIADAPYERVMMTFVNMSSEGLLILPTHRVVFGLKGFDEKAFVSAVSPYFEVERVAKGEVGEIVARPRDAGRDRTALAAVTADSVLLLSEKQGAAEEALSDLSPRQRRLDVVQLHKLILEKALGISEEAIRNQSNVRYVRDAAEAVGQVRAGEADIVFLMNPVRAEHMRDVAFAGEVMPQKSTDFYPKLLSGVTVYALE
jgi:uncharacterized protein (DUF1015 family)